VHNRRAGIPTPRHLKKCFFAFTNFFKPAIAFFYHPDLISSAINSAVMSEPVIDLHVQLLEKHTQALYTEPLQFKSLWFD